MYWLLWLVPAWFGATVLLAVIGMRHRRFCRNESYRAVSDDTLIPESIRRFFGIVEAELEPLGIKANGRVYFVDPRNKITSYCALFSYESDDRIVVAKAVTVAPTHSTFILEYSVTFGLLTESDVLLSVSNSFGVFTRNPRNQCLYIPRMTDLSRLSSVFQSWIEQFPTMRSSSHQGTIADRMTHIANLENAGLHEAGIFAPVGENLLRLTNWGSLVAVIKRFPLLKRFIFLLDIKRARRAMRRLGLPHDYSPRKYESLIATYDGRNAPLTRPVARPVAMRPGVPAGDLRRENQLRLFGCRIPNTFWAFALFCASVWGNAMTRARLEIAPLAIPVGIRRGEFGFLIVMTVTNIFLALLATVVCTVMARFMFRRTTRRGKMPWPVLLTSLFLAFMIDSVFVLLCHQLIRHVPMAETPIRWLMEYGRTIIPILICATILYALRKQLISRVEMLCPTCGYDLTGLPGTRCPECGKEAWYRAVQVAEARYAQAVSTDSGDAGSAQASEKVGEPDNG